LNQTHQNSVGKRPTQTKYDVVIIGGGHNGLVAAAYLGKAGLSVLVLERRDHVGGAAVSEQVFPGVNARLSAYAYLVSLFPQKIIDDLGLTFEVRRRSIASFTPTVRGGKHTGLLVSNDSAHETEQSFIQLTGNREEYIAFEKFYALCREFAARTWNSLIEPLTTRDELLKRFDTAESRQAWEMIVERPLGETVESMFKDDLVRGVVMTDAKIGLFTHAHDANLLQNRTLLYHIIGNETGEWRVPIGGMGAVTAGLEQAARSAGAEIVTGATVEHIETGTSPQVTFTVDGQSVAVDARFVLVNATPTIMQKLITGAEPANKSEGSVFKINMLLNGLPTLKAGLYSGDQAFRGTFHIDEGYSAMQSSYDQAAAGTIPTLPPGEMYCHSLTDRSILGVELTGYQTLTLFGLDMPYRLFTQDNDGARSLVLSRYIKAINQYLTEPLENYIATDGNGKPCIEAKTPVDLERELNMTGGNIFHSDLSWPFVDETDQRGTWGVETDYPNIFLCGSGALRGGCVSGIPGHNAAMKVLECAK
jgi:phytoene dehydrogenase-like protein